jgi:hypothetical protein
VLHSFHFPLYNPTPHKAKHGPQRKENDYPVPVKKLTTKASEAEKVKKVEHFPKPGVFSRFFPPIPSKLKQNGKSTPYIGYVFTNPAPSPGKP